MDTKRVPSEVRVVMCSANLKQRAWLWWQSCGYRYVCWIVCSYRCQWLTSCCTSCCSASLLIRASRALCSFCFRTASARLDESWESVVRLLPEAVAATAGCDATKPPREPGSGSGRLANIPPDDMSAQRVATAIRHTTRAGKSESGRVSEVGKNTMVAQVGQVA
jgi:hypothetical protein